MVALDAQGNVAAASSSNGATHKVDDLPAWHQREPVCFVFDAVHTLADVSSLIGALSENCMASLAVVRLLASFFLILAWQSFDHWVSLGTQQGLAASIEDSAGPRKAVERGSPMCDWMGSTLLALVFLMPLLLSASQASFHLLCLSTGHASALDSLWRKF